MYIEKNLATVKESIGSGTLAEAIRAAKQLEYSANSLVKFLVLRAGPTSKNLCEVFARDPVVRDPVTGSTWSPFDQGLRHGARVSEMNRPRNFSGSPGEGVHFAHIARA